MASMSKRLRFRVLTRDRFMCQYCGRGAPVVELHVDHVLPRSRGGQDTETNLVTACTDCSLGKGASAVGRNDRVYLTWDGYPWYWPDPDDEILQIAMCDPDFYPEPVL